jgi:hypothetical protein
MDFSFLTNAECSVKRKFKLLVITVLSYCFVQVQSRVTVHLNFTGMHVTVRHLFWAKLREMRERI